MSSSLQSGPTWVQRGRLALSSSVLPRTSLLSPDNPSLAQTLLHLLQEGFYPSCERRASGPCPDSGGGGGGGRGDSSSVQDVPDCEFQNGSSLSASGFSILSDRVRRLFWDTMNNGTAVRRPIVAVLGQFKGHAKQTWCKSLELNWPFVRRVGADNAKWPEIYISGH